MSAQVNAAKADVRGAIITGDTSYVRRYRDDVRGAEASLRRIQALRAGQPEQRDRLRDLDVALASRRASFEATLAAGVARAPSPATVDLLRRGETLSTRLDSIVQEADRAEGALYENRMLRQNLSEQFVQSALAAIIALVGIAAIALWRSVRRDLFSRDAVEARLRASEAKFAGILDIAVDAVISIDEQQTIVHFNRGASTLFGYRRDEIVGVKLETLLPPGHRHDHAAHIRGFRETVETSRRMGERRPIFGRRKDGTEFPAEASISKLQTPGGWLFTAVLRDVTEQKRRERHEHGLATAAIRLNATLDLESTLATVAELPVPILGSWSVLDVIEPGEDDVPSLRRVASAHPDPMINAALRDWEAEGLQWDAPDAAIDIARSGRPLRIAAVTSDWLEAHVETTRQLAIARRMGMHSLLIVPLRTRETTLGVWTIGSSAESPFDEHDQALAVSLAEVAAQAITNARLLREKQRAMASRDQVLGVVSHDLRNPLSAVSMLATRLQDAGLDADGQRKMGDDILGSVDWMQRLMQDLLDVTSLEAGRLSIERDLQSVTVLLERAQSLFSPQASARSIELRVEDVDQRLRTHADGQRVIQVLSNLLGNALRFTPAGGVVRLGAAAVGPMIRLSVRDTGPGIPSRDLPHVFDRFWQARRPGAAAGNGLGLAIARGIVEAHGGEIWVESTVGHGTTFFFTLPSHPDSPASHGVPSYPAPGGASQPV